MKTILKRQKALVVEVHFSNGSHFRVVCESFKREHETCEWTHIHSKRIFRKLSERYDAGALNALVLSDDVKFMALTTLAEMYYWEWFPKE